MQQATLWDALEEETPDQPVPVPPMGGTMERESHWADGDCRPESLTRLANLLLQPGTNIETMHTTDGHVIWFRIVATRIEGDHVMMTLQRIEPLVRGYTDWQREQGMQMIDEE
jgi:hypothetical protein